MIDYTKARTVKDNRDNSEMKGVKMIKGGALNLNEKVVIALVRVAELFKRRSSTIFHNHGLSFSQYNVLRLLETAPKGSLSITQVSKRLLVSTPNMSGIAKRLDKSGFVARLSDQKDDRKTILKVTSKGLEVVSNIRHLQEQNVEEFLSCFSEPEKAEFLEVLKKILEIGDYATGHNVSVRATSLE